MLLKNESCQTFSADSKAIQQCRKLKSDHTSRETVTLVVSCWKSSNQNNSVKEMMDDVELCDRDTGWEFKKKHIFILSSSGKPIFSKYGDEQELVTTFGLLQAIMSIVIDSGDSLKCIMAGKRKIMFLVRKSLYFVCMSSSNEPEVVLIAQLNFLYNQVLFILTSKIHDVLTSNPSADIRQLLGSDSTKLLNSACSDDVVDASIVFESIKSFVCSKELRDDILFHLKYCVEKSGAV